MKISMEGPFRYAGTHIRNDAFINYLCSLYMIIQARLEKQFMGKIQVHKIDNVTDLHTVYSHLYTNITRLPN